MVRRRRSALRPGHALPAIDEIENRRAAATADYHTHYRIVLLTARTTPMDGTSDYIGDTPHIHLDPWECLVRGMEDDRPRPGQPPLRGVDPTDHPFIALLGGISERKNSMLQQEEAFNVTILFKNFCG